MEDRNYFEYQISTIMTLRELIRINFPDLFKKLYEEENYWMQISIGHYQKWVEQNIELDKENSASLAIYSVAFSKTIEEVKAYASGPTR